MRTGGLGPAELSLTTLISNYRRSVILHGLSAYAVGKNKSAKHRQNLATMAALSKMMSRIVVSSEYGSDDEHGDSDADSEVSAASHRTNWLRHTDPEDAKVKRGKAMWRKLRLAIRTAAAFNISVQEHFEQQIGRVKVDRMVRAETKARLMKTAQRLKQKQAAEEESKSITLADAKDYDALHQRARPKPVAQVLRTGLPNGLGSREAVTLGRVRYIHRAAVRHAKDAAAASGIDGPPQVKVRMRKDRHAAFQAATPSPLRRKVPRRKSGRRRSAADAVRPQVRARASSVADAAPSGATPTQKRRTGYVEVPRFAPGRSLPEMLRIPIDLDERDRMAPRTLASLSPSPAARKPPRSAASDKPRASSAAPTQELQDAAPAQGSVLLSQESMLRSTASAPELGAQGTAAQESSPHQLNHASLAEGDLLPPGISKELSPTSPVDSVSATAPPKHGGYGSDEADEHGDELRLRRQLSPPRPQTKNTASGAVATPPRPVSRGSTVPHPGRATGSPVTSRPASRSSLRSVEGVPSSRPSVRDLELHRHIRPFDPESLREVRGNVETFYTPGGTAMRRLPSGDVVKAMLPPLTLDQHAAQEVHMQHLEHKFSNLSIDVVRDPSETRAFVRSKIGLEYGRWGYRGEEAPGYPRQRSPPPPGPHERRTPPRVKWRELPKITLSPLTAGEATGDNATDGEHPSEPPALRATQSAVPSELGEGPPLGESMKPALGSPSSRGGEEAGATAARGGAGSPGNDAHSPSQRSAGSPSGSLWPPRGWSRDEGRSAFASTGTGTATPMSTSFAVVVNDEMDAPAVVATPVRRRKPRRR